MSDSIKDPNMLLEIQSVSCKICQIPLIYWNFQNWGSILAIFIQIRTVRADVKLHPVMLTWFNGPFVCNPKVSYMIDLNSNLQLGYTTAG